MLQGSLREILTAMPRIEILSFRSKQEHAAHLTGVLYIKFGQNRFLSYFILKRKTKILSKYTVPPQVSCMLQKGNINQSRIYKI